MGKGGGGRKGKAEENTRKAHAKCKKMLRISPLPPPFDHHHPDPILLADRDGEVHKTTIFGPTCDSIDVVAKDIQLPEMMVGDWLYFVNMGAYTVAAASSFNGFASCPTIFYVESDVE